MSGAAGLTLLFGAHKITLRTKEANKTRISFHRPLTTENLRSKTALGFPTRCGFEQPHNKNRRGILNQVIGRHSINVQLLKVDAFHANTRLRTWESVLTDNSGGELFVSCFALLSALMDYSRRSILRLFQTRIAQYLNSYQI